VLNGDIVRDWWLAVFTGDSLPTLKPVGASFFQLLSIYSVNFNAEAGTDYQIAVGVGPGEFRLGVSLVAGQFPTNDHFLNRTAVTGTNATLSANNSFATIEPYEPREFGRPREKSVWWTWVAPTDGLVVITSDATEFKHIIDIYTGLEFCNLLAITNSTVDVDRSSGAPTTDTRFDAISGEAYQIRVASPDVTGGSGDIRLQFRLYPPPPNDQFVNRKLLTGVFNSDAVANIASRRDPFEPNHALCSGGRSVWWSWTAPITPGAQPRPVTLTTEGSTLDTVLAVYSGNLINSLTLVANNGCDSVGGNGATVTFIPTPGVTYQIAADLSRIAATNPPPDYSKIELTLDYSLFNLSAVGLQTQVPDQQGRVSFTTSFVVTNHSPIASGPLRVRLVARSGFSKTVGESYSGREVRDLGSPIPIAMPLLPGGSVVLSPMSGLCPAPDPDIAEGFAGYAKGWGVFGILEERFGAAWIPVDSVFLFHGKWPSVAGFVGPNGGVIRSDPSRPAPNLLLDIGIQGLTTLCEQQSSFVTGQAMFLLGVSNAQPDWVWSGPISISTNGLDTNALVTVGSLNGDATANVSARLAFAGSTIQSTTNLTVRLLNNCFQFRSVSRIGNTVRLELVDRPGKRLAIDRADSLSPPIRWTAAGTNIVGQTGSFIFSNTVPPNVPQRFYRAREVP
jgi:hypothetical protein